MVMQTPTGGAALIPTTTPLVIGRGYRLVIRARRTGTRTDTVLQVYGLGNAWICNLTAEFQTFVSPVLIPTTENARTIYLTHRPVVNSGGVGHSTEIIGVGLFDAYAYPAEVHDGNTPGWRWLGAAGAAESVGYPYTLESIAGRPYATAGASPATGSTTVTTGAPAPLQGRTIYSVYQVADLAGSFPIVGQWAGAGGVTVEGSLRVQHYGTDNSNTGYRVDTTGATNQAGPTGTGMRTVGRHVSGLTVNDGLTQARHWVDDATATRVLTPGTGMPWATTGSLSSVGSASGVTLLTVAYDREHNDETMRRVMAWLARRYGAPVPAGY
jgi:hypothetical protein